MTTRRQKRARAYIPKDEIIASLLSDLLPVAEARDLREQQVAAERIKSMFTPDHVDLHALGGSDKWWNLKMRRRGAELKAKDTRDTSIVAKHDRVTAAQREHMQAMARKLAGPSPFLDTKPRSRIPNRGFVKGHRPLRSGNSFQRRQP